MIRVRLQSPATRFLVAAGGAFGAIFVIVATARCGRAGPASPVTTTLRMGVGGLPQQTQQAGLPALAGNLALEGLVVPYEDGRLRPWLAESWKTSADGLSVSISLRRNAKFHDGNGVTAPVVADALKQNLPKLLGPAFNNIREIVAKGDWQLNIEFNKPSRFVIEALETAIQEPGRPDVGSGPYTSSSAKPSELLANQDYYLGRPNITRIELIPYANVRTAWAELLRGNIDMLYETTIEALDSLQASSDVAVYSYVRHYQYMIVFGSRSALFKSPDIRRELNAAINREALVKEVLNGHGVPSTGPVQRSHWALDPKAPQFGFDPQLAARLRSRHLKFTCLVPADSVYEPIALAVKQQLAAAAVDMEVKEVPQEQVVHETANGEFDALLVDPVSGPSLFRSYRHWYSKMTFKPHPLESERIDAALLQIDRATSDNEYRVAVTSFLQAMVDDPPAIFLAWGERARAVSRKFDVVTEEKGRDILINLRLWRPAGMQQAVSRN